MLENLQLAARLRLPVGRSRSGHKVRGCCSSEEHHRHREVNKVVGEVTALMALAKVSATVSERRDCVVFEGWFAGQDVAVWVRGRCCCMHVVWIGVCSNNMSRFACPKYLCVSFKLPGKAMLVLS